MTAHDDLEALQRLGMYVHGEGSDEDGEEFDAALSRIREQVKTNQHNLEWQRAEIDRLREDLSGWRRWAQGVALSALTEETP